MAQSKKDFEEAGVRTFVPYRVEVIPGGRSRQKPLVSSLIFVYASADYVKDYAFTHTPGVRYYPNLEKESREPGRIRDEEMEPFMRATSPLSDDVRYFDNDAPEYHKGDAVLITEGQFKGMQGHIFRVGKDRKVVVSIRNVCSLLISNIPPSSLSRVDGDQKK